MTAAEQTTTGTEAAPSALEGQLSGFITKVDGKIAPTIIDIANVNQALDTLTEASEDTYTGPDGLPVGAQVVADAKVRAEPRSWIISEKAKAVEGAQTKEDLDSTAYRGLREFAKSRKVSLDAAFPDYKGYMRDCVTLSDTLIKIRDEGQKQKDGNTGNEGDTSGTTGTEGASTEKEAGETKPAKTKFKDVVIIKDGVPYRPGSAKLNSRTRLTDHETEQIKNHMKMIRRDEDERVEENRTLGRARNLEPIEQAKREDRKRVAELTKNVSRDIQSELIERGVIPNSTNVKAYLDGTLYPGMKKIAADIVEVEKQPGRMERIKVRIGKTLGRSAVAATVSTPETHSEPKKEKRSAYDRTLAIGRVASRALSPVKTTFAKTQEKYHTYKGIYEEAKAVQVAKEAEAAAKAAKAAEEAEVAAKAERKAEKKEAKAAKAAKAAKKATKAAGSGSAIPTGK